ncbi:hypothetical protein DICPUDRAFT_83640 [Dictyostelium purpureum]|uniref:Uncharacterized protein n=1 Tax=Dictyostelium purpureum TaxID=5786 RepID=F1A055_DICPU|nr:uncharacterized protein DICPUDRAFT_83640 [Dictyostelium purpureum]EGC30420.1 hypothetical protein DICPUDRAFT_83640 [Dictyostelium purpureum]|eukprot:XP_003293044.1 hypothetical protein DICPUDRAFT_83640 [Dictyostelium purpureum]
MGIIFLKKNNKFENFVAMESKISEMETKIKCSKNFKNNVYWKIILYGVIIEIFLLLISYINSRSFNTLFEKSKCYVYSILFSIIIYTLAKLYNFLFQSLIKSNENKLKKLNVDFQKLLDDTKLEADIDNLKKKIEVYENLKKRNQQSQQPDQPDQPQQPQQPQQPNQPQQPDQPDQPQQPI